MSGWLDYAADLGVSGVALGPIFASSSHGYDTIDHYRLDERLGGDADFDHLVGVARQHGLRLLLDGVFNHVGRDFPTFRRVLETGPDGADAGWFRPSGRGDASGTGGISYATFEGHHGLVALNHDNPAVADYVSDVMRRWLDRGADGWRLDAAYAVPTRFWAEVSARVKSSHPDAYLVGEVIHGDYAAIVAATGLDSVTQYELWKAIWSSLNDGNLFELAWALGRHNTYVEGFAPMTFIGNHDVTRLATRLRDDRHLAHALVVLLTTAGTPSIYYGDERAFEGVKEDRTGGDDAVRPAYPARPSGLDPSGASTYLLHRELIRLRRQRPWLHRARTDVMELSNRRILYSATHHDNRLVVALNLADEEARHAAGAGLEIIAGSPGTAVDHAALIVPAQGWLIAAPVRG